MTCGVCVQVLKGQELKGQEVKDGEAAGFCNGLLRLVQVKSLRAPSLSTSFSRSLTPVPHSPFLPLSLLRIEPRRAYPSPGLGFRV